MTGVRQPLGSRGRAMLSPSHLGIAMPTTLRTIALALPLLLSACGGSDASTDQTQTVTLSVGGMDCEGCATTLRNVLSEVQGVETVQVDLAGKSASVVCSSSVEPKRLVQAIHEKSNLSAAVMPR